MLTPQELLEIVETMHPILDELNTFITNDMISRLMARLGRGEQFLLTGTDQWQAQIFQEAGGHLETLQSEIQRFTKKSDTEVKAIFENAGITAWTRDNAFFIAHGFDTAPLLQSERMLTVLTDAYKRTNGEIHNFTRTTAKASQQRLVNVMDTAHIKVMTGAQSYTEAVKDAVNEIAKTQTKVHYPTGHVDTIETAVLRAIRTGTAQASGNISLQGMIERDWDLIRVSSHLGARTGDGGNNPSNHFWWQGGLYSRTGRTKDLPQFEKTTGYGTGEGLCGWNCRHSFGPGERDHNPFKDFESAENEKTYNLSQSQRNLERRIRQSKLQVLAIQTAIDNCEDAQLQEELKKEHIKAAALLQRRNTAYNKLCEDNNLKRLNERIAVAQWNRSRAARATAAARKA